MHFLDSYKNVTYTSLKDIYNTEISTILSKFS